MVFVKQIYVNIHFFPLEVRPGPRPRPRPRPVPLPRPKPRPRPKPGKGEKSECLYYQGASGQAETSYAFFLTLITLLPSSLAHNSFVDQFN